MEKMTEKDIILSKAVMGWFYNQPDTINPDITIETINKDKTNNSLIKDTIFYGTIKTTVKRSGKKTRLNNLKDIFQVVEILKFDETMIVKNATGEEFKTSRKAINLLKGDYLKECLSNRISEIEIEIKEQQEKLFKEKEAQLGFSFLELQPEEKLRRILESGINNIWMVGPAGCGKSTLARNLAESKSLPYLCISCGVGTSATEFIGYKYPEREATRFSEFYAKPSIILIDEMTALDPAVAQILNAALANGEIETTTGLVRRHKECIIIATSNTFGTGADRQYVANNQLDASTIDRFVGGIVEVTYSEKYESKFDTEVVEYVKSLRMVIKENNFRRVASTRMIIAGQTMKHMWATDWRDLLILNWSDTEKEIAKKKTKDLEKAMAYLKKN